MFRKSTSNPPGLTPDPLPPDGLSYLEGNRRGSRLKKDLDQVFLHDLRRPPKTSPVHLYLQPFLFGRIVMSGVSECLDLNLGPRKEVNDRHTGTCSMIWRDSDSQKEVDITLLFSFLLCFIEQIL